MSSVRSLAALAWATVSVTNQKRQETEMGHVCQFVWWHQTHPIILVAHPEHKSPQMFGRFSPIIRRCLFVFFIPMMPWCVVWRQPQKRRGCRQPETNTCTPLLDYVCVSMWMWFMWSCEAGYVFNELQLCVECLYMMWGFVLIVEGVGMHRSTGSEQRMQLEAWPSVQRKNNDTTLHSCMFVCVQDCSLFTWGEGVVQNRGGMSNYFLKQWGGTCVFYFGSREGDQTPRQQCCCQYFPVATSGIAAKKSLAAQKAFPP